MSEQPANKISHQCVHENKFLGAQHERNERRTWIVVIVTAIMMVVEIVGGTVFGSMALVADGWHMGSHAGALGISALAYRYASRQAANPAFAFGTAKVGELAGFASAVVLGVVALLIGAESVLRLINPREIYFDQAIPIAVIGLAVNLWSAWLLQEGGHHHHDHDDHDDDHEHHDHHHHTDNNLRAAYLHVLADALTSVLAITGLLAGLYLGWVWADPMIGILGGIVIAHWSWNLMRSAGRSLLDMTTNPKLMDAVKGRLETESDSVRDLHVWRLGPGHQALIVSVVSNAPEPPEVYKARLEGLPGLSHITVEVNPR